MSRWTIDEPVIVRGTSYTRLPELLKELGEMALLGQIRELQPAQRIEVVRAPLQMAMAEACGTAAVRYLKCYMKAHEDVPAKGVTYLCNLDGKIEEAMKTARAKAALECLAMVSPRQSDDWEYRRAMEEVLKTAVDAVLAAWRRLEKDVPKAHALFMGLTEHRDLLRNLMADVIRERTDEHGSAELMAMAAGALATVPQLHNTQLGKTGDATQMAIGAVRAMDGESLRTMCGLGAIMHRKSGLISDLALQTARRMADLDGELTRRINEAVKTALGAAPIWFGFGSFANVLVLHVLDVRRLNEAKMSALSGGINAIIHEVLAPFGQFLPDAYGIILKDGRSGEVIKTYNS